MYKYYIIVTLLFSFLFVAAAAVLQNVLMKSWLYTDVCYIITYTVNLDCHIIFWWIFFPSRRRRFANTEIHRPCAE